MDCNTPCLWIYNQRAAKYRLGMNEPGTEADPCGLGYILDHHIFYNHTGF